VFFCHHKLDDVFHPFIVPQDQIWHRKSRLITCCTKLKEEEAMRLFFKVVVISLMWISSATALEYCTDIEAMRSAIAKGDWPSALANTERCIKWNREGVPQPPVPLGWDMIHVSDVYYWELSAAILNARLGNMRAAEQRVAAAAEWQQLYDLGPSFLITGDYDGARHVARGYISERRGDSAGAKSEYDQTETEGDPTTRIFAHSRLALLALNSGNDGVASGEAAKGNDEPTTLYVKGALAEHMGALGAAFTYYEQALKAIDQTTTGSHRSVFDTFRCIDRDLIAQALENARRKL
jgi:tetratricopeptide (TPR) repeat protein